LAGLQSKPESLARPAFANQPSGYGSESSERAPIVESDLRAASARAISLIQKSQATWAKKETCQSCHHQLLPEVTFKMARERRVQLDERVATDVRRQLHSWMKDVDCAVQRYDYIDVFPDALALFDASEDGVKANISTDAYALSIASRQLPDGSWLTIDARP